MIAVVATPDAVCDDGHAGSGVAVRFHLRTGAGAPWS